VSVESPFRQHTQVDLEQDHKMSDDILNRGEVVHRALAMSYWAPTWNQTGKLWFLEHICHKVWAQIYEWSNPMHPVNDEMKSCIAECLRCYQTCLSMAMGHCLEIGGQHTEPKHFTLMMACAEICRTSAHFMLLGSELHKLTCRACAEICEQCAADCERIGEMRECVDACRRCAESCQKMAA
jgi:hypothetical protein